MGQFPVTDSRRKILERIPDYAVRLLPAGTDVSVTYKGQTIAESSQALLVKETKHADVYYFPRDDVEMDFFTPTEHSTYCPFKGHASYWSLVIGGDTEENVVWSYESPYTEVEGLKDYLSFYDDRVEIKA